jgi:hypothetical protein
MPFLSPPPVNCFVGMFDVIGFKALRALLGTSGLHQKYRRGILPAIAHSAAGKGKDAVVDGQQMYVPDLSGTTLKYLAISDSVLFLTPDDSFASFFQLVNSAFMLLQFGFGGKAPFRGAIGWGDLIDDPSGILLGSAIEDAYAGESQQAWAGAMLTSASRDVAISRGYIERFVTIHAQAAADATDERTRENAQLNSKRLVRYPVPTQVNPKDGSVQYGELDTYAINWTIRMYVGASQASFDEATSQHAATIAVNTRNFEDWARAR